MSSFAIAEQTGSCHYTEPNTPIEPYLRFIVIWSVSVLICEFTRWEVSEIPYLVPMSWLFYTVIKLQRHSHTPYKVAFLFSSILDAFVLLSSLYIGSFKVHVLPLMLVSGRFLELSLFFRSSPFTWFPHVFPLFLPLLGETAPLSLLVQFSLGLFTAYLNFLTNY